MPELKTISLPIFDGRDKSKRGSVMERVKTFEDACNEIGIYPVELSIRSNDHKDLDMYARKTLAHLKLMIIAKALNEDWEADWSNESQGKYYPWFDLYSPSGPAFCGSDYRVSYSTVGSRLCYKSRELAEYAGKQFIDIYKEAFS